MTEILMPSARENSVAFWKAVLQWEAEAASVDTPMAFQVTCGGAIAFWYSPATLGADHSRSLLLSFSEKAGLPVSQQQSSVITAQQHQQPSAEVPGSHHLWHAVSQTDLGGWSHLDFLQPRRLRNLVCVLCDVSSFVLNGLAICNGVFPKHQGNWNYILGWQQGDFFEENG
jgi:hypothetical protein